MFTKKKKTLTHSLNLKPPFPPPFLSCSGTPVLLYQQPQRRVPLNWTGLFLNRVHTFPAFCTDPINASSSPNSPYACLFILIRKNLCDNQKNRVSRGKGSRAHTHTGGRTLNPLERHAEIRNLRAWTEKQLQSNLRKSALGFFFLFACFFFLLKKKINQISFRCLIQRKKQNLTPKKKSCTL